MAGFVKIHCPHCKGELDVEADWLGLKGQCPYCETKFVMSPDAETLSEETLPAEEVPVGWDEGAAEEWVAEEPVAEEEFLEMADDAVGNYREENAVRKFIGGFLDKKWLVGGVAAVVLSATMLGVTIVAVAFQRHTVVEKGTSELSEEGELYAPEGEEGKDSFAQSEDNKSVYAKEIEKYFAERKKRLAIKEKETSKSSEEGKREKSGLEQKVYNGSPRAELIVGLCFTNGVSRNYADAVKLYKAAQRGNVLAQFALAEMFMKNTDHHKDIFIPRKSVEEKFKIKAFEEYRKIFEHQYKYVPVSCDTIDHPCVDHGGDVAKVEAAYWYRKAAEQGYAPAQFRYGECLKYGKGCKEDKVKSGSWFKKAAEQGLAPAVFELSRYTGGLSESEYLLFLPEGKEDPRRKWLERAAYQGYAPAQFELGREDEHEIVLKMQGMPMLWYRKAAEQWHADAMVMIGLSYYFGKNGVEVDKTEARRWLEAGAEDSGLAMCFIVREMFHSGALDQIAAEGSVSYDICDIEEAIYLYRRGMAIEQGCACVLFNLAKCLIAQGLYLNSPKGGVASELDLVRFDGWGTPDFEKLKPYLKRVDLSEPMSLIRKAAELNDCDAQIALGDCYAFGVGVTTDKNMAAKWYRKAVENGSDDAKERLKKL